MSVLVQISTPVLSGGISQQPAHLRAQGAVEDASNVVFPLADGFTKRPGTYFERQFAATPNANLRMFMWDVDGSEQYAFVYGAGFFAGYRIGGAVASITVAGAASTYLALNTATADQMRARLIGNYALVINSTVATAVTTADSFTVERIRKDYEALVSFTTTTAYYERTEEDSERAQAGYYQYTPGTYLYGHINFETLTNQWSVVGGYWDDTNYFPSGFRMAFRRVSLTGFTAANWTAASRTLTKTGAFTSYTFRAGDMIYLTAGTGFTANAWYTIASRTSNDAIVLATTQPAGNTMSGADQTDLAANVTAATYSETNICRIGIEVEANVNFSTTAVTDMNDIAYEIQRSLRAAGATNACCAWVPQTSGGNFQITGPYRGNNAIAYLPTAPTAGLVGSSGSLVASGAPFNSTNAQVFGGSGGAAADGADTATPESRWTRVAEPGQSGGKIDTTTMPVKLTRASAGNFNLDPVTWDQRTSGSTDNNPAPRMFTSGQKITDTVLFRDRLFFVGGNAIAGSETADHENFFKDNYANIVDSDPIDRVISGEVNSSIIECLPFRNAVWINTAAGMQFEMAASGEILTPATVSVTGTTRYRTVENIRSASAPPVLYLATERQDSVGIYEYFYDDLSVSSDAEDVTKHVPTLLPSLMRSMAASATAGVVAVVPTRGYRVFLYKAAFDGNARRRVQSAWGRAVFDSNYRIVDVATLGDDLWMIVEISAVVTTAAGSPTTITHANHGLSNGNTVVLSESTSIPSVDGSHVISNATTNTYTIPVATTIAGTARYHTGNMILERLPLSLYQEDEGWAYAVHGDRRVKLTGVHSAGTTTWTLPNNLGGNGSTLTKAVLGPAFGASSGTVVTLTGYGATTVSVSGDYSAGDAVLCRDFSVSVELSRPFVRDQGGAPLIADLLDIETIVVRYTNTSSFGLTTMQTNRADRTRNVDNGVTPASGKLATMLNGEADAMSLSINDTTVRPLTISGIHYECRHHQGSHQ